jgi:Asp-tRNA(Asn)/Glu-tRNA(Gln) amidotransferase A subunit family amidase
VPFCYLLLLIVIDDFNLIQGTPCGVQVFAPTMRDEECLELATQVDRCLHSVEQEGLEAVV